MRAIVAALLVLTAVSAHAAEEPMARKVKIKIGDSASLYPIISLPYDRPAPTGPLRAREGKTGKEFPVTVKDGTLTFVPEGGLPNTEHTYEIQQGNLTPGYVPNVVIKPHDGEAALDVFIQDKLLTAYYHPADGKKPYLWPLNAAGDTPLTRGFPMDPNDNPKDHPHHRSFWSALGDMNGADCWAEGEDSGYQASGEVTSASGDAFGWIHAKNVWQDHERKPIVDEEREYHFYATPETARMIDVKVTFTANYGDVKIGDTKEGGVVSVRMRRDLCGANAIITNALGDVGEPHLWGKPAAWCDYSGKLGDAGNFGITIFDTPTNLRYPTSWHVRAYGLMGANCFGWHDFGEKEYNKPLLPSDNGDYLLKSGEKLTFNYRVYVHKGDVNEAAVADRFADYTTPPAAVWVD